MNKLFPTLLLTWVALFLITTSFAEEKHYFDGHAQGWHWYQDPKQREEVEEKESSIDPVERMNAVRATIQRLLDQAVLEPNKENIKNYISLQNELMLHAGKFDRHWQEVLLENPELNYSLIHPTNNLAKQVEYDQRKIKEDAVIHELAKKSGLFFFYRSTCPYCQKFAPIVKDFADSYGITVIPITTDGIALPEFPDSYINHGQAEKFKVTVEPALFAVNPYTHQAFPVAYGLTSQAEIKRNILELATHFEGDAK